VRGEDAFGLEGGADGGLAGVVAVVALGEAGDEAREDLPVWEEPRRTTLNSAEGISTCGMLLCCSLVVSHECKIR